MRDQLPPTAQPVTASHTAAEEETTTAPQWRPLPPRAMIYTAHCRRTPGSPSDNKKLPLTHKQSSFSRRRAGPSGHQLFLAHGAPPSASGALHRPTVSKNNSHITAFQPYTHKRITPTGHHLRKHDCTTNTHGRRHTSCSSQCHKSGRFTDVHTHTSPDAATTLQNKQQIRYPWFLGKAPFQIWCKY